MKKIALEVGNVQYDVILYLRQVFVFTLQRLPLFFDLTGLQSFFLPELKGKFNIQNGKSVHKQLESIM